MLKKTQHKTNLLKRNTFNELVDRANRCLPCHTPSRRSRKTSRHGNTVEISNTLGYSLGRGEVVELDDLFTFDLSGGTPNSIGRDRFANQDAFKAKAAEAASINYAIVGMLIEDGQMGIGWVDGICDAKVFVNETDHEYCLLVDNQSTIETTAGKTEIRILSKEDPNITGPMFAKVQLGIPVYHTFGVADVDIDPDGFGDVSVWIDNVDTNMTIEAHLAYLHGDEQVSAGKEVLCLWVPDEGRFVIIAAECEEGTGGGGDPIVLPGPVNPGYIPS